MKVGAAKLGELIGAGVAEVGDVKTVESVKEALAIV